MSDFPFLGGFSRRTGGSSSLSGWSWASVYCLRNALISAGLAPIRQLRPVREMSQEFPETELTAMDAKWWNLVKYDSAVVSMNDGTSVALYKRDPAHYRDLMKRAIETHRRFHREWPELARQYREALGDITSPEAWEKTFAPWTESSGDDR